VLDAAAASGVVPGWRNPRRQLLASRDALWFAAEGVRVTPDDLGAAALMLGALAQARGDAGRFGRRLRYEAHAAELQAAAEWLTAAGGHAPAEVTPHTLAVALQHRIRTLSTPSGAER